MKWFSAVFALPAIVALAQGCSDSPSTEPPATTTPDAGSDASPLPDGGEGTGTGTFFAVYIVGSDLEDDAAPRNEQADEGNDLPAGEASPYGAGSDDLREMIEGYNALSAEEKKNATVYVAFGGARKAGWKGVKYADMDCIIKDGADNIFGNDTCYAMKEDSANMADAATLKAFLEHVGPKSAGYKTKMLTLWNHGGAYDGIGVDTNQKNFDLLTLPELTTAFSGANSKWDAIGMDACLMASLEVAAAMKPFGDYLVASEETEPGHGWDYRKILAHMGKNPSGTPAELGRAIVDAFIDGTAVSLSVPDKARVESAHATTDGKTLSVIDLRKVDAVVTKLGDVTTPLSDQFPVALSSFEDSEGYGKDAKGLALSVDLKDFATTLKRNKADLAGPLDALSGAVADCVAYTRNDGKRPRATGLAIYTPVNKGKFADYKAENFVSPGWNTYVTAFNGNSTGDTSKPTMSNETDQGTSRSISVTDDRGLKDTQIVYVQSTGTNTFRIWGARSPSTKSNSSDFKTRTIEASKWDGKWLTLCNGACTGSNGVFVPAYFDEQLPNGHILYTASGTLRSQGEATARAETVIVHIEMDGESVVDSWVTPYEESNGEIILDKEQYHLGQGDIVSFDATDIDISKDEETSGSTGEVTLTAAPAWGSALVAPKANLFYFFLAEDAKGNMENSTPYAVQ